MEMRTKWGFNEVPPDGIEKVRNLIIREVNKVLKEDPEFGHIKLIPYDRAGVHNWCLIEFEDTEIVASMFEAPAGLEEAILEILHELDEVYDITSSVHIRKIN
jgi:hypothetical protein